MTDTPTKPLSERFGGFDSAEQQERAVFMDAFDAADSKLFAKGVAAGIAAIDRLRARRLAESHPSAGAFKLGDLVQKKSGSSWRGKVVGFYATDLTPRGYCIESAYEPGSVQIYPEAALAEWKPELSNPSAICEAVEGEREACAKLVAAHGIAGMPFDVGSWTPGAVAAAIRARGEEKPNV